MESLFLSRITTVVMRQLPGDRELSWSHGEFMAFSLPGRILQSLSAPVDASFDHCQRLLDVCIARHELERLAKTRLAVFQVACVTVD
jgi:hypothetical protein